MSFGGGILNSCATSLNVLLQFCVRVNIIWHNSDYILNCELNATLSLQNHA